MVVECLDLGSKITVAHEQALISADIERQKVREGRDPWPIYGTDTYGYEDRFASVLYGLSLNDFLQITKNRFGQAYAFEAFGDGALLRTLLSLDGGIANTLVDFRYLYPGKTESDNVRHIEIVEGDILSEHTNQRIKEYMVREEIEEGFHLVTVLPIGGWTVAAGPDGCDLDMQWVVINTLWQLVNPRGGMMLADLNPPKGWRGGSFWATSLKLSGVDFEMEEDFILKIIRRGVEPRNLPIINS